MGRLSVALWVAIALSNGAAVLADDVREAYVERGRASWYGEEFQGEPTASGDVFDQNRLTAAHPDLPLGAKVEVINLDNGKSVEVEINDRGPFGGDRAIDLSKAAAAKLDMLEEGTAPVRIEASQAELEPAERHENPN